MTAHPLVRFADAVVEATVVGSFTSVGHTWRSRAFGWDRDPARDARGKTVLITGPTSGLGRSAAGTLVRGGANLIAVGRSPERLERVASDLAQINPQAKVEVEVADLDDLTAVAAAARRIAGRVGRGPGTIDAVIHNAGALDHDLLVTGSGLERTFQNHVVAPHLMTRLLQPALTAKSRVVTVSSGGMYTQRLPRSPERVPDAEAFDGVRAYAQAKRAQVDLIGEWSRRFPDGPQFHGMHPGWADTPGVVTSLPGFHRVMGPLLRDAEQGADTMVWLAVTNDSLGPSGGFWLDRRRRGIVKLPRTGTSREDTSRLWETVEELTQPHL